MAEEEKNYTIRTSDRSKKVALILCIFLGFLGAHDFYLGRIGSGILKLFTANIFVVGWVYDIVKIATGTYKDGAGAPVRK